MAFIYSSKNSSGNEEVNTASVPTASTQVSPVGANIKYEDINQIDEDDIEEMYIKWNMALLSMRADRYWKKTGKKISIQGTDVAGFNKSKVEYFNCHKMGHFARECRAPRSQERGMRGNYKQGYMANEEDNHALVVDEEAPTEFALMAKSSTDNEVFDNSLCSKACKKNTDSLNSQITELNEKLGDTKNMLYHYKLETLKKEKEGLDRKLSGFKLATKDLDNLIGSQRSDKIKKGLGYSAVPPPVQVYSPPKKDISSSASENGESTGSILSKPEIKFVKPADSPTVAKTNKKETVRKPTIKYAKLYRKTSKWSNVRGNQRNWNNLKSQQLGKNFVMKKACYNCGCFDHISYDYGKWVDHRRTWAKNNYTHKSRSPRTFFHKTGRPPIRTTRSNMNAA
nr:ribonuclease H-like domain-containing protein [Tanacetum cinerariifolium]